MRRLAAIPVAVATVAVLATAAASAPASDIYIWGTLLGRVPGKNAASVQMRWAYKCLGDKLGGATYEWTLKVTRRQPLPEKTTTLGHGTSKFGKLTVKLPPGDYLPFSDPYRCETERGAGYGQPEIGAPFRVPDYCSWSVSSVRGVVELEHGSAVKAARPGTTVVLGDGLATPKGGTVSLSSVAGTGEAELAGSSRLDLDAKSCSGGSGWLLALDRGSLTVSVQPSAPAVAKYRSATPNATVLGAPGARWRVGYAKKRTTVRALAGHVGVAKRSGPSVALPVGKQVTIG